MASLELHCLALAPPVRNCATLDTLANFLVVLLVILQYGYKSNGDDDGDKDVNNNNSCLLRLLGLLSSSNAGHYYGPEGFKISNKSFKSEYDL